MCDCSGLYMAIDLTLAVPNKPFTLQRIVVQAALISSFSCTYLAIVGRWPSILIRRSQKLLCTITVLESMVTLFPKACSRVSLALTLLSYSMIGFAIEVTDYSHNLRTVSSLGPIGSCECYGISGSGLGLVTSSDGPSSVGTKFNWAEAFGSCRSKRVLSS